MVNDLAINRGSYRDSTEYIIVVLIVALCIIDIDRALGPSTGHAY